ncbi:hypothetical protein [Allorhodopirellula solitaria]|uniref:Uncharacterized protein n=1 Tax=Allorhodopirellula solitaria TaxID=2527987 RepID=A0A5C5XRD9_9BACT|nr:hypothetical protein [Allorhodopirellula solitaria]TWT65199.1 hypothetical protein CA85_31080 [Allorhodopirellula solitaria]
MPQLPIDLECLVSAQLTGPSCGRMFLYGLILVWTLTKPDRISQLLWTVFVIVAGYIGLGVIHGVTETRSMAANGYFSGSVWTRDSTLAHAWVLAALVCLTQVLVQFRERNVRFTRQMCQFMIADLMMMTTVIAIFAAAVLWTPLIQHGPSFWLGMLVIGAVVPTLVIGLRFDGGSSGWVRCSVAVAAAGLLSLGLGWAESRLVQPGKIDFAEAAVRYGCLIAAMMTPRLIEQSVTAAHRWFASRLHLFRIPRHRRPALDADRFEILPDAQPDPPRMPRSPSRRADPTAAQQAQWTVDLIA